MEVLELATRPPFDGAGVVAFLGARAVAGVEEVVDGTYRRVLTLPGGDVVLAVTPGAGGVRLEITAAGRPQPGDVAEAADRVRHLFDLDADPHAIVSALGELAAPRPGLRRPGIVDRWELSARAVLGQQITVAAARRLAERLTERLGTPLATPSGGLTHRFPAAAAVAAAPDDAFPMPRRRADTLRRVAALHAAAEAPSPGELLAVPGIGPWTAGYIALRRGDPDVFLPTDVAVVRALGGRRDGDVLAERWRPFRSYAVLHLWASLA